MKCFLLSFLLLNLSIVLADEPSFIPVQQDNLLHLELKDGVVSIRLAQELAPLHSNYIRKLVNEKFYDGLPLYRVVENFVVQGGDVSETKASEIKTSMPAEFEWPISGSRQFTLIQSPDIFAEQTGYVEGFAVGRSLSENKEWLIHCPGVINLARAAEADSGTTDFAIMFGVSPRHLDRNMSAFGQIIDGWDAFYKVRRGLFEQGENADTIIKAYMGSSLPSSQQSTFLVENTNSEAFKQRIKERRLYKNEFFKHKGNGNLDVCYTKPQIQQILPTESE